MASSRGNERGFVLLGTIWLLVLAGAVGAALLLRSLGEARAAAAESRALADRMALDGAAEAAFASLLFNGQGSALTGGAGQVTIGNSVVGLRLSSEGSRFDVNEADPQMIAGVLQSLGVSKREGERIVGALAAARAERRRLASHAELRRLLGPAAESLEDVFTLYSGLSRPPTGESPEALARSLASPDTPPEPIELRAGTPLRIDAALPSGARLTAVGRLTALQDDPLAVQRWEHRFSAPERRP